MLDLSNNNGAVDWNRVRQGGTRRVYLKLTEGHNFHDKTYAPRRQAAHREGILTGAYHFARPSSGTALEEANFFLGHLPKLVKGKDLRPCLDFEDPAVLPSPNLGTWVTAWVHHVQQQSGHVVVIYGSSYYLEACRLPTSMDHHPLWLAGYGRNDGREHPYQVPPPWHHAAAHQYASTAHVSGVAGQVDISHVLHPAELDVAVTR